MSVKRQLIEMWLGFYYRDPAMRKKIIEEIASDDYFRMGRDVGMEVEEWVTERISEFTTDFERDATEKDGMLEANRCIAVDDAEEFLFFIANEEVLPEFNGLGIYWAWDKYKAECHWGKGAEHVYIHALIPFDSIDLYVMLMQNLRPSTGVDESEVTLKEGSKVFVTEVEMLTDRQTEHEKVQPPEPIPMKASAEPYRYRNIIRAFTRS